jgi:hypothetical protein
VKHPIRQWTTGLLATAALSLCLSAGAGYTPGQGQTFNLGAEGIDATIGADMRIRLEGYERTVVDPEMCLPTSEFGPAYEYLRVRTRLWLGVKVQDWMKFNARLVNRSQYFSSRPGENNDGWRTWEFPDETIFDQLNLQLPNIADSDWSLTIGRQDLPLGNGMVFLEGTPYDQGRTIYFDGVSAVMKKANDTLKLFAFYNRYQDKTLPVINEQHRRLSRGDIFTAGAYWTHTFRKCLSTDLYYIFADVMDNAATGDLGDDDAEMHTAGLRLFGAPHDQIDYSLEFARELGPRQVEAFDLSNTLIDARLTLKAPKDTKLSPSLLLQYTFFSGDKPETEGFEGWDPMFATYPIFREELLPIMFGGRGFSNLHQGRLEGRVAISKTVSVATAYAYLRADQDDLSMSGGRGGSGSCFGQLVSAFVDYKPRPYLSFALEVAEFYPGSYFEDGDNSTWGRFQTTLTF